MASKEHETLSFTLDLSHRGLGFTIAGGSDLGEPLTVSKVCPDGAAHLAGMTVGDELISVNGVTFNNVTHSDAVNLITHAIPHEHIVFTVRRDMSSPEIVVAETPISGDKSTDQLVVLPPGKRASNARDAFKNRDPNFSRLVHELTSAAEEQHQTEAGQYVKAMVFGGLDGIITTFAVVASVNGANLSTGVVIIMGFANLIADGISMGFGEYLSAKSEMQYVQSERNREEWEFENCPDGEIQEMIDLYKAQGFQEEDAKQILHLMAQHKKFFIDHMMVQELGLMPPDDEEAPWKNGLVMFFSFLAFGLIPLLSYIALSTIDFGGKKDESLFGIAIALTACALFALGALKSKFSTQSWYASGFSVLINGAIAAGAAYLVGFGLEQLVDAENCESSSTNVTTTPAP